MRLPTATFLVLSALPVALSATPASAADIQVGYRVDAKVLKSGCPAGTPLSFQLFTDSTCTTWAGAPQVANVEAATLIEQPKLIRVKGGPRPPSVAEIRYTVMGITPQPVFYATVTGTGIIPAGGGCQLQTASVGGALPPPPLSCSPDAVLSGSICVDKYEASLWQIPPGATTVIQHVTDGTVTLAELTGAGATQMSLPFENFCAPAIPGTFPSNGNYTAPLYAVSVAGVHPTGCITPLQASAACGLSAKRLLTNIEWLAAASGTPDPDTDNGTTDCNTGSPGTPTSSPSNTGGRSSCVSTAGAFDMVGNVYEWTTGDFSTAWARGGWWLDGSNAAVSFGGLSNPLAPNVHESLGFRCAR